MTQHIRPTIRVALAVLALAVLADGITSTYAPGTLPAFLVLALAWWALEPREAR